MYPSRIGFGDALHYNLISPETTSAAAFYTALVIVVPEKVIKEMILGEFYTIDE
jgi:hypothetical protein